jgi:TPR repeat protein
VVQAGCLWQLLNFIFGRSISSHTGVRTLADNQSEDPMLIIEIAVGVFLGGMGLWMFVSHREKQKQAEYDREQERLAFDAAERYVTERFRALSVERLDDFRARLATIFDDSSRSPIEAAKSEWELSREYLGEAQKQAAIETREALKENFSNVDRIGARDRFDQHIDRLFSDSTHSVSNELMLMYVKELKSFNDDDLPSVTHGNPRKQFNLGNAHRLGENVEQDYKKSERLLRLSASQGYTDAQTLLGSMYYSGEGVEQNYQEALKWHRLSAEKGDSFGQNMLGLAYAKGQGVEQDYFEALKWHRLSATQGCVEAMFNLGKMYRKGQGVKEDSIRARMWYLIAAANGSGAAEYFLLVMNDEMTSEQIKDAETMAQNCVNNNYQDYEC